jgi:hypothetical protein
MLFLPFCPGVQKNRQFFWSEKARGSRGIPPSL